MYLNELIAALAAVPADTKVPLGFDRPHSYRGDYAELAFRPAPNTTAGAMLAAATSAIGQTFTGYKGGEYKMGTYSTCWFAEYGCCGETLGPVLLAYMLGTDPIAALGDDTRYYLKLPSREPAPAEEK